MAQHEGRTSLRAFIILLFFTSVTASILLPADISRQLVSYHSPSILIGTKANAGTEPFTQPGGTTSLRTSDSSTCESARYQLPSDIALAGMPAGVTVITDSPQYYRVKGFSTAAILRQMQACAPGGKYAAQSGYNVSWYYGYAITPAGQCEVVDAKIGLHLNMMLPQWHSDGSTPYDVRASWDEFSTALLNHELGHHTISRNHASIMLAKLKTMRAADCLQLQQNVQKQMDKSLKKLQAAQIAYDATTNHGQTQGAELR